MKIPKLYENIDFNKIDKIIKEKVEYQLQSGQGLYLWGKNGVGKTHIAYAIAKELDSKGIKVCFEKVSFLMERLRKFEGDNYLEDICRIKGVLFLDDIGSEKSSEWVREKLYLILDHRIENRLPVILTSNCDIKTLAEKIGGRLSSRIAGMTEILEIKGDDKRLTKNSV